MYTRRTYSAKELAIWTRFDTLRFFVIILIWVSAYFFLDLDWLRIPWTPLALIGTAVAFIIGFQVNQSTHGFIYALIGPWEAFSTMSNCLKHSRFF